MAFSVGVSKGIPAGVSVVAILALVFFTSFPVYAQVAGATLSGTVTDQQGAVVSGAKITVRAIDTGIVTNAESNSAGFYSVPNLNPADYEISFGATGFNTSVAKVTLRVGDKQVGSGVIWRVCLLSRHLWAIIPTFAHARVMISAFFARCIWLLPNDTTTSKC
jgi:hypothetical protein